MDEDRGGAVTPVMTRDQRLAALQARFPAWHVWYVSRVQPHGTDWYARRRDSPLRTPDANAETAAELELWLEVQDCAHAGYRRALDWCDAQGVVLGVPWHRLVPLW